MKGTAVTQTGDFEFGGINHIALVCQDMERTVDFYTNVLGMALIKTLEMPTNTFYAHEPRSRAAASTFSLIAAMATR